MLPVNTGIILAYLFPYLDPTVDYSVQRSGAIITLEWFSGQAQPTEQEIIDAELDALKTWKTKRLKREADRRMRQINSAASFDNTALLRGLYLSVEPVARGAFDPIIQQLVDVWSAGSTAATAINGLPNIASVDAYDVVNNPGWPA